jgi:hypothetical protein
MDKAVLRVDDDHMELSHKLALEVILSSCEGENKAQDLIRYLLPARNQRSSLRPEKLLTFYLSEVVMPGG